MSKDLETFVNKVWNNRGKICAVIGAVVGYVVISAFNQNAINETTVDNFEMIADILTWQSERITRLGK